MVIAITAMTPHQWFNIARSLGLLVAVLGIIATAIWIIRKQ